MKDNVGDWLVLKSGTVGHRDLRGLITSVHSLDGDPPYGFGGLGRTKRRSYFRASTRLSSRPPNSRPPTSEHGHGSRRCKRPSRTRSAVRPHVFQPPRFGQ